MSVAAKLFVLAIVGFQFILGIPLACADEPNENEPRFERRTVEF